MELQIFTKQNTYNGGRGSEPTIRVTTGGYVGLSKSIVETFGVEVEDRIALAQDKDSTGDWYLIPKHKEGYVLRKSSDSGSLAFNNAAIAKQMLDSLELDVKSISFKVSTTPIKHKGEDGEVNVYAILTAGVKAPKVKTKDKKKDDNDEAYEFGGRKDA